MKAYPSFSHGAPISIATPCTGYEFIMLGLLLAVCRLCPFIHLATVAQKMDRAIHRINSGKILVKKVLEKIIA